MRLAILPFCLVALPAFAQWDFRLELPRPTGQSLPQTMLTGSIQLAGGELNTGNGFIASANRRIFEVGPLLRFEGGVEYSQMKADGSLVKGAASQSTQLKQQGIGAGVNVQLWVPFVGIAGEIGLIQRFQRYTFDTTGASTSKDLGRTWLRVGTRWRLPFPVVSPYLVASYQQPVSKDRPVKISSTSDLASYLNAQGSGQEFERMWTFGAGVTF